MYQCGRCGLTRASGQEMGVIQQCRCPWEFVPPVMQQQRTWVGLTWHDVPNEWIGNVSFMEGAKWAEAKFKEKNG
jgi:hypothetical protein